MNEYVGFVVHPVLGRVMEHRAVLYDKIGPGTHRCHWCGARVIWMNRSRAALLPGVTRLVSDHVNENKSDNSPDNLVPSCIRCNVHRSGPNAGRVRKPYRSRGRRAIPLTTPYDPKSRGPLRRVARELAPTREQEQGQYRWRYQLECGHVMERRTPGQSRVYCDACAGGAT